ncbi:MAG: biotin carboxylase N-terminal domain-containing protein [Aeromicrobium sp.]|uniref:acetyl/propionyl/methylcrotonyl-CoA carboxylase subunit alpha n=1 Tax=Aeromicrobium sp. TaxID=1871063 RepID=UPI00260F0C2C|nr:biotin carboxylase N-terminal domain-containing protein [Aeromicrobium sp.]MDF1706155.1 biotin carboxylase N-terminal domain-containing protein [Aeromicrobium sp.]
MTTTVLVANRGEIALRVFRTARSMGMRTVAIHTDIDAAAPHVRAADLAVAVPSYLDVDAIVAAAREVGADVVHPGYGFLSERASFSAALADAGIALAGPSAAVMEQMGRKDAAREVATAAGVPVVPSYGIDDDPTTFAYPVMVKAAAGGGGKGMRVVRDAAHFAEAAAAAGREAASSFGDDTLLVEKYVESGRHLEVQVMADSFGHTLHLWERDCSTQRRHQKVLEEAPAPTIDEATRTRLTQSAVDLAREVEYVGAGTVEYLLDNATGEFYFLEMNTRLQVEHPVTEAITGLDLVELQLRVAAGERLALTQDEVRRDGWAIEARVYAEDAFGGFLPQAGRASHVSWPIEVRVDHALFSGQIVSTSYDPMLGKVIATGADREAARTALVDALDETVVLGLTTNTGFLRALAASAEFRDCEIDTAWLDVHEVAPPAIEDARVMAAWVQAEAWSAGEQGPFTSDGYRIAGPSAPLRVRLDEEVVVDQRLSRVDDRALRRLTLRADGDVVRIEGSVEGRPVVGHVRLLRPGGAEVVLAGQRFLLRPLDPSATAAAGLDGGRIVAPMPGTVLDVRVAEGDEVVEGDVLGTIEAMKMELSLRAPCSGRVTAVGALAGQQVPLGAVLFEVDADGEHTPEGDGEA